MCTLPCSTGVPRRYQQTPKAASDYLPLLANLTRNASSLRPLDVCRSLFAADQLQLQPPNGWARQLIESSAGRLKDAGDLWELSQLLTAVKASYRGGRPSGAWVEELWGAALEVARGRAPLPPSLLLQRQEQQEEEQQQVRQQPGQYWRQHGQQQQQQSEQDGEVEVEAEGGSKERGTAAMREGEAGGEDRAQGEGRVRTVAAPTAAREGEAAAGGGGGGGAAAAAVAGSAAATTGGAVAGVGGTATLGGYEGGKDVAGQQPLLQGAEVAALLSAVSRAKWLRPGDAWVAQILRAYLR